MKVAHHRMREIKTTRSISLGIRPFGMSQALCIPPDYYERSVFSEKLTHKYSSECIVRKLSADRKLSSSSLSSKVAVGRKPSNVSSLKRPQRRSSEVRVCFFIYLFINLFIYLFWLFWGAPWKETEKRGSRDLYFKISIIIVFNSLSAGPLFC